MIPAARPALRIVDGVANLGRWGGRPATTESDRTKTPFHCIFLSDEMGVERDCGELPYSCKKEECVEALGVELCCCYGDK